MEEQFHAIYLNEGGFNVKSEKLKVVSKKIILNLLMLLIILAIIVAITGVPINFNIYNYKNKYITNMPMADVGNSIKSNFKMFLTGEVFNINVGGEALGHLLISTAKKSLVILFWGTVLALIIGVLKGVIDSRKKDQIGTGKMLQSLIPLSLPDILIITLVQLLAYYLYSHDITFLGIGPIPSFGDESAMYAIYPIISIAILPAAYISRITANIIEENFTKPYILAARGKGCSTYRIIKNHMMKEIMFGVLSAFPAIITIMFSSLVIVEKLYYWRGMTFYLLNFYSSDLLKPEVASFAFSAFIVFSAVIYYLIFMIFNILKKVVIPNTKTC